MPQHTVEVTLPPVEILNSDALVNVWSDKVLLGTIKMSRGSIDYRPNGHEYHVKLTWEEFDELMREKLKEA